MMIDNLRELSKEFSIGLLLILLIYLYPVHGL